MSLVKRARPLEGISGRGLPSGNRQGDVCTTRTSVVSAVLEHECAARTPRRDVKRRRILLRKLSPTAMTSDFGTGDQSNARDPEWGSRRG